MVWKESVAAQCCSPRAEHSCKLPLRRRDDAPCRPYNILFYSQTISVTSWWACRITSFLNPKCEQEIYFFIKLISLEQLRGRVGRGRLRTYEATHVVLWSTALRRWYQRRTRVEKCACERRATNETRKQDLELLRELVQHSNTFPIVPESFTVF